MYMDIGQGMLMGQNKENGATNRVTLSFKMQISEPTVLYSVYCRQQLNSHHLSAISQLQVAELSEKRS